MRSSVRISFAGWATNHGEGVARACALARASSTAKLWPAMTTAWPRSISFGTTASTTGYSSNAFDLIELNGHDLRRDPLGVRKAMSRDVAALDIAGFVQTSP